MVLQDAAVAVPPIEPMVLQDSAEQAQAEDELPDVAPSTTQNP